MPELTQDIIRYRGFDQENLDREYRPASCIPDIAPFIAAYAARSAAARAAHPGFSTHQFGATAAESLDFFPGPTPGAPLHVFIHGGYWRMLSKDESSFPAPGFHAAGAAYAALNYTLAPGASLDQIVAEVRAALVWLYHAAPELGFDAQRIFVSGSSAGGHLVGMVLATNWAASGVPADLVKGAVAISGVFDLAPIRLCYVNAWLNLDAAAVARNSPAQHLPLVPPPVLVAVGEIETDEFKRQSAEYAGLYVQAGGACAAVVIPARNHFDILFDLSDPATELGARTLAQMGLAQMGPG